MNLIVRLDFLETITGVGMTCWLGGIYGESRIKTAIQTFELEIGRLPTSMEELVKTGDADWPGPFLEDEEVPKDGWGNEFRFKMKNKRIKVMSAGPDGQFDTEDDIVE